jgi:hypothetical protein
VEQRELLKKAAENIRFSEELQGTGEVPAETELRPPS